MLRKANLIIAAHPDDEILGCGGLINKFKKARVDSYVLILTDGVKDRYPKRMISVIKENALEANKKIGTKKVFFENLPNQKLDSIPVIKITQLIEKYIERLNVDCVFTHHAGDLNKDHLLVYEATITASRPMTGQKIKKVYTYNVSSATEWNSLDKESIFVPNFFIDIKDELETKVEAMKCYKSECRKYPHPRSPEAIRAYSNYWGITIGLEYAEPFKLIRQVF